MTQKRLGGTALRLRSARKYNELVVDIGPEGASRLVGKSPISKRLGITPEKLDAWHAVNQAHDHGYDAGGIADKGRADADRLAAGLFKTPVR